MVGALIGFAASVLLLAAFVLIVPWSIRSRARSWFVLVAVCIVLVFSTWWVGGWSEVFARALRSIPALSVMAVLAWLTITATKKQARIEQECAIATRPFRGELALRNVIVPLSRPKRMASPAESIGTDSEQVR